MIYEYYSENELIYYAYANDEHAIELLVSKYHFFIWSIIHKSVYDVNKYSFRSEELFHECVDSFIKAIYSYRHDLGVPFNSYIITVVRNRVLLVIRRHMSKAYNQLNLAIPYDSPFEHTSDLMLSEVLTTTQYHYEPEHYLNTEEVINKAIDLYVSLPHFDKKVFQLRNAGYSYKQIAQLTNTSTKQVDNSLQRIRNQWK